MTRDEARQWIPILQGYADGKHIQVRNGAGWLDGDNSMMFNNHVGDYRIKPEPKYRKWTEQEKAAECAKGTVLRHIATGATGPLCRNKNGEYWFGSQDHVAQWEECVIAATGAPCGVQE